MEQIANSLPSEPSSVDSADGLARVFLSIARRAEENNHKPDDYLDESDGFYHCAKCKGRKQRMLDTKQPGLGVIKVWCTCPCESERIRKEDAARREAEERAKRDEARRELAVQLKKEYMKDDMLLTASFDTYFEKVFTGEFDTPASRRIYKIATRYVQMFDQLLTENKGLMFFGPTGTGKTYTAACIANALYEKGIPVVMTSLPRLTDSIEFGDDKKSAQAIIERFNRADLLIIDDLGIERLSSFAQEKAYEFINGRYEAKKPLLITTNLTIEELTKTPSLELRRVYERITEFCHAVEFTGPSIRRQRSRELFASMTALLEGE